MPQIRGLTLSLCLMMLLSTLSVQASRLMEACSRQGHPEPQKQGGNMAGHTLVTRLDSEGYACLLAHISVAGESCDCVSNSEGMEVQPHPGSRRGQNWII